MCRLCLTRSGRILFVAVNSSTSGCKEGSSFMERGATVIFGADMEA